MRLGPSRSILTRPTVFFPLMAVLAVLSVHGVIEAGLALNDRWERDLMLRMDYYRAHQPRVLAARYRERLRAVRGALEGKGYRVGPAGAAMGPRTAEALRAFQRHQGLQVTGRPDPPTITALGLEP